MSTLFSRFRLSPSPAELICEVKVRFCEYETLAVDIQFSDEMQPNGASVLRCHIA